MDHSHKSAIDLDELSKLFRDIKFNHASVNEKFDVELFTLGYLAALQSLNGVNKINTNLQDLIHLRNLESDGRISRQEKLEVLTEIIKLTQNPSNISQTTSVRVLPERLQAHQRSPRKQVEQGSPTSQTITHKRSKSNEGKNLASSEKGTSSGASGHACCICGNKMKGMNYAKLQNCGHCFHDSCLKSFLQRETNTKTYPIRCPVETCGREIEPTFLQTKLDPEHAKKFWDYAFARNLKRPDIGYSWCPTQGCKYFYMAPKPMLMMFRCPLCQKHYCLNCRAEYHRGQTCDSYQKSQGIQTPKLDKDVIRFKQCPKCQKWVEYQKGNHIHCSCNTEFCVNCGENPSKCNCEVIRDVQGGNRTPSGSEDLEEETFLYKMIMKDQEVENARLKGTYQERPPEEGKDRDANKYNFPIGKNQYS